MNRETAMWLKGQIDGIRRLSDGTMKVLALHSKGTARELGAVRYSCNRAWRILDAEQDPCPEGEADGAARSTED